MISFTKILAINILILFLGLFLIEIFFGAWFKSSNYHNLLIPRQQTNLITSFPYDHDTLGIYSRDKNGFRANSYDLDEINILILGGSTTEEREVDDKKIWTKVFENNLNDNLKVLNAGIGGQTSYGHKSIFKMWFQKHTELSPDYILVYLGINDALYLVEYFESKKPLFKGREKNSSNRDTLININRYKRFIQFIKNNSVFHSVYLIIKGNIISNKYQASYNSKPSKFIAFKENKPKNLSDLDNNFINNFRDYYFQNLIQILNYSKNYNAKTIFVTQVLSPNHWLTEYLRLINNFTINFCNLKKISCINIDNGNLNLLEKHFYDGIHTTPKGSKIIGKYLAREFNNLLPR